MKPLHVPLPATPPAEEGLGHSVPSWPEVLQLTFTANE